MTTPTTEVPPRTADADAAPVARRARRAAATVCLVLPALAVAAFGGQLLVTGWLDSRPGDTHHVQDLAWGAMEGVLLLVALIASLRAAHRRPAALAQALAVVAALLVTMVLTLQPDPVTGVLAVLVVLGVVLSPARSRLGVRDGAVSRPLVVLAAAAAVTLVPYAVDAAGRQRAGGSPEAELFGYTGATAWALAVVAVVAVAALRLRGWQVPALSAAVAVAVVGVASLLWPDLPSSLGVVGGTAALVWSLAVAGIALVPGRRARTGTPSS